MATNTAQKLADHEARIKANESKIDEMAKTQEAFRKELNEVENTGIRTEQLLSQIKETLTLLMRKVDLQQSAMDTWKGKSAAVPAVIAFIGGVGTCVALAKTLGFFD